MEAAAAQDSLAAKAGSSSAVNAATHSTGDFDDNSGDSTRPGTQSFEAGKAKGAKSRKDGQKGQKRGKRNKAERSDEKKERRQKKEQIRHARKTE